MSTPSLPRRVTRLASHTIRRVIWSLYVQHQRTYTFSTRQGVFTVYGKDNVIGNLLYCTRQYERELILQTFEFLRSRRLLPPGGQGTLVDIGDEHRCHLRWRSTSGSGAKNRCDRA